MRHFYPAGYKPVSYCRSCGKDFASGKYFELHRFGAMDVDYHPVDAPHGRRCLDVDELRQRGLECMSDVEMLASPRHSSREGFGVELWFDPARKAYAEWSFQASRQQA